MAISALRLGKFVSVLGIGNDGSVAAEDLVLENFDSSIEHLRADSAHWFTMADIETGGANFNGRKIFGYCAIHSREWHNPATVRPRSFFLLVTGL